MQSKAHLLKILCSRQPSYYSLCDGTIGARVNDLPDLIPPESDLQNLAGNHILLKCKGADILMAHLQRGKVIEMPRRPTRAYSTTAFSAQERRYFDAFLCHPPSAVADAQAVHLLIV